MKRLLLALLPLIVCIHPLKAQITNKVMVIGIDGCRPDALVAGNTPNMDALMANGSFSLDALNDRITISGPGWGSMLTGVWPNKHGITDNTFLGANLFAYPHFFDYIEDHDPNLHTVSISQWIPINIFMAGLVADNVVNPADNTNAVRDAAVSYLTLNDPDAIFIHFDDVDHEGHASGFTPNNPAYVSTIEGVDAAIGDIMTAVNNRPNINNENWAFIISTDHGGLGTNHGGNALVEEQIFIIVSGDSIPNQRVSKDSNSVTVPPPLNCLADSVELTFDGNDAVHTNLNATYDFGANQDFSVECRIRTTNAGDVAIVTDKDWDSGLLDGWVFSFVIGSNEWKVNVGDGGSRIDLEGNLVDDGEWHTLSATFDRDGMCIIYEDGVAVDSASMSGIGNIYSGNPISFGADADDEYDYTGSIAEVRIFDDILTASEIDTWKCTQLTNSHSSWNDLIGYWRLTEGGTSTTVFDSSPTGANGTLAGPTWQDALDTMVTWVYDFSNTPRQVDVAVTALEHLCIPIDPNWGLDGQIFGAECDDFSTSVGEPVESSFVTVYPNPRFGGPVQFEMGELPGQTAFLEIYDLSGRLLVHRTVSSGDQLTFQDEISNYSPLIYRLWQEEGELDAGLFY